MLNLLLFYLGCYGLTTLIVQSVIFRPIRNFFKKGFIHKLLNCMMCTGFWVGLFSVLLLGYSPTNNLLIQLENPGNIRFIYSILFDAFSVVSFVWLLYIIQSLFEDNLKREL